VNLEKTISRKRKAAQIQQPIPKTLAEVDIPEETRTRTELNEHFLLHDSGPADQERVILFGSRTDLARLAASEVWVVDGTFWTCPELFYQLWVIHGRYRYCTFVCLLKNNY
jgi:hypothetical protein